jgi:hypothetical protein
MVEGGAAVRIARELTSSNRGGDLLRAGARSGCRELVGLGGHEEHPAVDHM